MSDPPRVAILGGTFDPVHAGHLALIVAVREALGAREGWLLPAREPPLRGRPVAPAQLRQAMLEAAVRGAAGVRVEDMELRRPGVSYTVDTLLALARTHPEVTPWWILGADAARHIAEWHRPDELLAILRTAIVQRAGFPRLDEEEARSLGFAATRTIVLDLTPPDVSASEVRRRVAAGERLDGLVPPPVIDIIAASGLYRAAASMP